MSQLITNAENWFETTFFHVSSIPNGSMIMVIIAIIFGLMSCFLGYRLFGYIIDIVGFLLGVFVGYWVALQFSDVWWICLICAVIVGILFCMLAIKLYFVSCFLATGIPAALIVCALLSTYVPSLPNVGVCIIGIVVGILLGVLTVKLQRPIIIITTAFQGAYTVIYGIFKLTHYSSSNLLFLLTVVLAIVGAIFQFTSTKKEG